MQQSNNYCLFLDTTQNKCNIAILKNHKIASFLSVQTHNNMTDIVVELLAREIKKNNIKLKNIKRFYLLIGPGSFTGCRVGYIIVKAFASLFNTPVYYLNSLMFQTSDGNGVSIIDAKSDKKYVAVYKNYKNLLKEQLVYNKDINKLLSKYSKLTKYIDYQKVNIKKNLIQHLPHFVKCDDLDSLEPLYIKDPV